MNSNFHPFIPNVTFPFPLYETSFFSSTEQIPFHFLQSSFYSFHPSNVKFHPNFFCFILYQNPMQNFCSHWNSLFPIVRNQTSNFLLSNQLFIPNNPVFIPFIRISWNFVKPVSYPSLTWIQCKLCVTSVNFYFPKQKVQFFIFEGNSLLFT